MGAVLITIKRPWTKGQVPSVEVSGGDVVGICCHLAPDAFIEWEDAVRSSHQPFSISPLLFFPFSFDTTPISSCLHPAIA
jgi:hypothetical protein